MLILVPFQKTPEADRVPKAKKKVLKKAGQ